MNKDEEASLMAAIVLTGGFDAGISTNPDINNRPSFIEINDEKVVCTAQGGECRHYGEFYTSGGLQDPASWKTPIINKSCPNTCPYKHLVCDNHDHTGSDIRVFKPYRQYNKFAGQFETYCKDFSLIECGD